MCMTLAGKVETVDAERDEAVVDIDGDSRVVSLAPLAAEGHAVTSGAWVLIHTGMAVALIDDDDAAELQALNRAVDQEEP
jgi:hydrogenase assembly chaperone HypC/HupF